MNCRTHEHRHFERILRVCSCSRPTLVSGSVLHFIHQVCCECVTHTNSSLPALSGLARRNSTCTARVGSKLRPTFSACSASGGCTDTMGFAACQCLSCPGLQVALLGSCAVVGLYKIEHSEYTRGPAATALDCVSSGCFANSGHFNLFSLDLTSREATRRI